MLYNHLLSGSTARSTFLWKTKRVLLVRAFGKGRLRCLLSGANRKSRNKLPQAPRLQLERLSTPKATSLLRLILVANPNSAKTMQRASKATLIARDGRYTTPTAVYRTSKSKLTFPRAKNTSAAKRMPSWPAGAKQAVAASNDIFNVIDIFKCKRFPVVFLSHQW